MPQFAVVLRQCAADNRDQIAALLGRAFSLKDSTCGTIIESVPIILIDDLDDHQAATMCLALAPLQAGGAVLDITDKIEGDLPKIEWPKAPLVFKLPIETWVLAMNQSVSCPDCNSSHSVLELLLHSLQGPVETDGYRPQAINGKAGSGDAPSGDSGVRESGSGSRRSPPTKSSAQAFTGAAMPEITPFSNPVLPPSGDTTPTANSEPGSGDVSMRMDEMFPEDDAILPDSGDVTNILDKLLPDEQSGDAGGTASTSQRSVGSGGFSVFLSKISDDGRRKEAVPLLAEVAGISEEDADKLSKKVIIPVLRGVSQEQAEQVKHRFAQIKVLARVKSG